MWIKSLAPVEKGSAVFHSLIIFPLESIYFTESCKVMFFCFWEISLWSVVFFICTNHTVPSVVLVCTCACAWTVVFLYFLRQGRSLWWELGYTSTGETRWFKLHSLYMCAKPNVCCSWCFQGREVNIPLVPWTSHRRQQWLRLESQWNCWRTWPSRLLLQVLLCHQ